MIDTDLNVFAKIDERINPRIGREIEEDCCAIRMTEMALSLHGI